MQTDTIRALCFDVFGTVVDWRGSVAREMRSLSRAKGLKVNATRFADAWRAGYAPAMDGVRRGETPWMTIDALHRQILGTLVKPFGLEALDEAELGELNRAWQRLKPWPDSVRGLKRLKKRFTIATLSNGNVSLLNNMAKAAGLPWDVVLSAELFGHYKPDPEVYLGAVRLLGLKATEVMMVAAHPSDLAAARRNGLATALVRRPREYGRRGATSVPPDGADFDISVNGIDELAARLNA